MGIPSDTRYAQLTIETPQNPQRDSEISILGENYTLIDFYCNADNGYQGYAYKNNVTNEIVVVHAGSNDISNKANWLTTETGNDWLGTNGRILINKVPSQFLSADFFLESVKSKNANSTIVQTGQSLGGSLSQMLGMLDKNKDILSYCYNPLGTAKLREKNRIFN